MYLYSKNKKIVLIDPSKRVVYDQYGEEGLTASWDVGPRYKSTEEVLSPCFICVFFLFNDFLLPSSCVKNMKKRQSKSVSRI
jgi:DnaJ-class molecular chaperone